MCRPRRRRRGTRSVIGMQLVRVADPDGGHELRGVADEPGVAVVLGRAGLAGDRPPAGQLAPPARAVVTTPSQERVTSAAVFAVSTGLRIGRLLSHTRPSSFRDRRTIARGRLPKDEPSMRRPPSANAAERAGHLERVDRLGAEPDREVGSERARDAQPLRRPDDRGRADDLRQLRVDRVVGVGRSRSSGRCGRGRSPRSCGRTRSVVRAGSTTGCETNCVGGDPFARARLRARTA